jgi:hypothetical protein
MLRETAIEFRGEFRRERQRVVRCLISDRVPEIFDELKSLGDGELTELIEIDGALSHEGKVATEPRMGKRKVDGR